MVINADYRFQKGNQCRLPFSTQELRQITVLETVINADYRSNMVIDTDYRFENGNQHKLLF